MPSLPSARRPWAPMQPAEVGALVARDLVDEMCADEHPRHKDLEYNKNDEDKDEECAEEEERRLRA